MLIIAGDSFCASDAGWPSMLAKELNLPYVSFGQGGQHWWGVKKFLDGIKLNASDILIIVHTNAERIPTDRVEPGQVNFSNPDLSNELDRAVDLYFKHLFNHEFLQWAQMRWIEYIDTLADTMQVLHLHSFDGTPGLPLAGLSVEPSLLTISLKETNGDYNVLADATRLNHMNDYNNQELARQLADLITKKERGVALLDLNKFSYK